MNTAADTTGAAEPPRPDPLRAEGRAPVTALSGASPPERADASALPAADHHVGGVGAHARDRLASRSHHREERLHPVDPVPEQVGVGLLEGGRAEGIRADHLTDLSLANFLGPRRVPERRGGEDRDPG